MGNKLESKVIPITERNILKIVDIMDRTKNYIPYCNFKCHEGVILKEYTEKLCIRRGCTHYVKYYI